MVKNNQYNFENKKMRGSTYINWKDMIFNININRKKKKCQKHIQAYIKSWYEKSDVSNLWEKKEWFNK